MTAPRWLRDRIADERGVTLVLFSIVIVVMMAFAALVIDLGNGRQEKRHIQNGVDAASLGAAKVYDGMTNDGTGSNAVSAKALALKLLVGNGFDVATTATAANTYPCLGEQDCTVSFSWDNASNDTLCVDVALTDFKVSTTFARVTGVDNLYVSAHGNGCRRRTDLAPEASPSFFSAADNCDPGKAFNLSGSNVQVVGTLRSNADLVVSGSNSIFGQVTYRTTFTNSGGENTFQPPPAQDPMVRPFPLLFDIASYQPGGARAVAAGSDYHSVGSAKLDKARLMSDGWLVGGVLQQGIYYTSGEMDLDLAGVTAPAGGVTFVAEGKSVLKWADGEPVPYEPSGLFVFSNYQKTSPVSHKDNCTPEAFVMSGQHFHWAGLIYVPRGGVDISASDVGAPINGAILAHAMLIQGQNFVLAGDPSLFPTGIEELYLDQ